MEWMNLASNVKYSPVGEDHDIKNIFPDFSLWEWGTGRYSEILGGMQTDFLGGQILLGDYEYEHSRQMHAPANTAGMNRGLTFCILEHEDLDLPPVHVRSEAPAQKIFKRVLGKHDIYFAEDPEFSERFEIQGPEAEIHQLFRPEIRSYFLRHFKDSALRLECKGNSILIHFGMMIYPEDCRYLIYHAVNIANFWMNSPVKYEIPPEIYFKGEY